MSCVVEYGVEAHVDLDVPADKLLALCAGPQVALDDVSAAVGTALGAPLNYPALARATVPGDHILLALEAGVPQASALVAAMVGYLVEHGATADHIGVLTTPESVAAGEEDPREMLPEKWRGEVSLEVHAPEISASLSLLGSSHEGKPIYLNRTLLDADLVVPIGCLRGGATIGYYGRYGGLFPAFADAKTRQRFGKPAGPKTGRQRAVKEREEIDEVGWLLGTQFTVQVLPGPSARVLRVLAGELPEVYRQGEAEYVAVWTCSVPRRASLVVASVSGGASQQTWENLARALSAASRVTADGGAIALCTQLSAEPGGAVNGLSQSDDLSLALKRIARDGQPDAAIAVQLARSMEQGKVYLLSRLDESLVEDLGLAPVGDAGELGRLARSHDSCIVLANAQYVLPVLS
ncbi:MAG TPA: lactate racemase domain-containing protein [Pirellulales bacterium]|nr:lactate racemase domain-containing protein [Pirellulales bacterium]